MQFCVAWGAIAVLPSTENVRATKRSVVEGAGPRRADDVAPIIGPLFEGRSARDLFHRYASTQIVGVRWSQRTMPGRSTGAFGSFGPPDVTWTSARSNLPTCRSSLLRRVPARTGTQCHARTLCAQPEPLPKQCAAAPVNRGTFVLHVEDSGTRFAGSTRPQARSLQRRTLRAVARQRTRSAGRPCRTSPGVGADLPRRRGYVGHAAHAHPGRLALIVLVDAESMADRLADAGMACDLQVWDRQVHIFQAAADLLPEGARAIGEIGRFVRSTVPGSR